MIIAFYKQFKYLGLWLDPELRFKPHIDYVLKKVYFGIGVLYQSRNSFTLNVTVRRHCHWLQTIFKCIRFNYPYYLKQQFVPYTSNYQLRHSSFLFLLHLKFQKQFSFLFFSLSYVVFVLSCKGSP